MIEVIFHLLKALFMKKKYFFCALFYLVFCSITISANVSKDIYASKDSLITSTIFQSKTSQINYTPEFQQIMKNFSAYKLVENIKLIEKLENEVNENSFEMGVLAYYKAYLYLEFDDFTKIQEEKNLIEKIIPELKDKDQKILLTCYSNMISIYKAEAQKNKSDEFLYATKNINMLDFIKNKNWHYLVFKGKNATILANYFVKEKKFEEAAKYAELSSKYYSELRDPYYFTFYYRTKGYLESTNENPEKALEYYKKMMEIVYKEHSTYNAYSYYPMVAMAYKKMGDDEKSANYLLKFKMTNDTIQKEKKLAENYLKTNFEKNLKSQENKKRNYFLFFGFILIIFDYPFNYPSL